VTTPPREEIVGTHLPASYAGDDTCHLWRAGIPCLLYGPRGSDGSAEEPDNYVPISEMTRVTRVLVRTALDVCGSAA
jgi:acetylornithine deacetylase